MDVPGLKNAVTDEEQDDFLAEEKPVKNWAENSTVRERIRREIAPLVKSIRDEKQALNMKWNRLLKIGNLEHEEQRYTGRSNIYIPAGKKVAETVVSQLVSATFPGDDNFGVEALRYDVPEIMQQAVDTKDALKHVIDSVAKVRVGAERFYRQLVYLGNSPVKIFYDRREVGKLKKRKKNLDDGLGEEKRNSYNTIYDGPVFQVVPAQNFYAYPSDANDLSECQVVFEDLTVSLSRLREQARAGVYVESEVEELGKEGTRNSERNTGTENAIRGVDIGDPQDINTGNREGWGLCELTEVWLDFDPTADVKHEEDNSIPFLITIAGDGKILRAIENPFEHKRPPYLLGRMGITAGRLWGTGFIEAIRELNILLNDQTNQAMDCATYALNPIVLTNPNLIQGKLTEIEPGVQWLVNDVNGAVKFDRPPTDLIQWGSVLTGQTMSWMNDYGGAPPVLQGGSSPGRAFRTATGIGTAQQNARVPLQEVVRLCEAEVWEPMLFMFWSLMQQFSRDDYFVKVSGTLRRVDRKALKGDWVFAWLASTQTSNQAIKGTQLTQLMQVLSTPQVQQALMQNGKRFNPEPLIRRLYQEVNGFRDVDNVIVPIQPPPQQALPPGAPQPPGGPLQMAQDPAMNLPEGLADNDEFLGMREGADEMAAYMGGSNNAPMPE